MTAETILLGDDLRWRILTSDHDGKTAAEKWIRSQLDSIADERRLKEAQKKKAQQAVAAHTKQWHQAHVRFVEWNSRSLGIEAQLRRRLDQLTTPPTTPAGFPVGTAALERQRRRADRCNREMKHAVNSLADLASLVEAHVAGTATVAELDQALDDLTVVGSGDSTVTLRALLAGKRAAYKPETTQEA